MSEYDDILDLSMDAFDDTKKQLECLNSELINNQAVSPEKIKAAAALIGEESAAYQRHLLITLKALDLSLRSKA